jgi:hypothetical protein
VVFTSVDCYKRGYSSRRKCRLVNGINELVGQQKFDILIRNGDKKGKKTGAVGGKIDDTKMNSVWLPKIVKK